MRDGRLVAVRPESSYDSDGFVREVGMVTECLSGVDVGNVNLYEGYGDPCEGVPDCHADPRTD